MPTVTYDSRRSGCYLGHCAGPNLVNSEIIIGSGAGKLYPGSVLGRATSTGKYYLHDASANDGREVAAAILFHAVDATSADVTTVGTTRGPATINGHDLIYAGTLDSDQRHAAREALRARMLKVLPQHAVGGSTPTPTPTPSPTISFAASTASVPEGNSGTTSVSNTVNVVRNGATGALIVNLVTGGTATSGVDYVALPATVTIADGANSVTFPLLINGDTTVEPDETIGITATLAAYPSATATKAITVLNDDVVVPAAPTISAASGDGQALVAITDDPASQGVQKYNVYRSATAGGPYTLTAPHYIKGERYRRRLTNGAAAEYAVVRAYNAAGEGPASNEVALTAASTNYNPLRLTQNLFFQNTRFFAQVWQDYKAGSSITSATSSDGTPLTVTAMTTGLGTVYVVDGIFATTGDKVISLTETTSGNATNTSTFNVRVVARPAIATRADVLANAQAVLDRFNAKAAIVDAPIAITDMGGTMPAGYTASHVFFPGRSHHATAYTNLGGLGPTAASINAYDPVERKMVPSQALVLGSSAGGVIRMRLFKQTMIIGLNPDYNVDTHFAVRYTDDGASQRKNGTVDPVFIKARSGSHFYKLDFGSAAPNAGRVVEFFFSDLAQLADSQYVNGFGYEAGETPQAVADTTPVAAMWIDSFVKSVTVLNILRSRPWAAADYLNLLNINNFGSGSHRYINPAGPAFIPGVARMGGNPLGYNELALFPDLAIGMIDWTINDQSLTNYAMMQAGVTNDLLLARYYRANTPFVVSVGAWDPTNRISAQSYNALKAGFDDASGNGADWGMALNDGTTGTGAGTGGVWAIPAGAVGSSDKFMSTFATNVTGSITGSVLNITAVSSGQVAPGQYVFVGGVDQYVRVYKAISASGTGAGTWQLATAPIAGDLASTAIVLQAENYTTSSPVHPEPVAGYAYFGQRDGMGVIASCQRIVAG